ncbi:hypothetical protein LCGC14_1630680 [marine sediment metagenome]|uniref:Uncharacterized protein n=1 Tax=marine sediment metagenome TaxID=412755 RepID=A0A0F9KIA7_9ZZZZ
MNLKDSRLPIILIVMFLLLLVTTLALVQTDFERYLQVLESTTKDNKDK